MEGEGWEHCATLMQDVAVFVRVCIISDALYVVGSTRKFDKDCFHDNVRVTATYSEKTLFSASLSTTSNGCNEPSFPP
jgi:hypothetical protein